MNFWHYNRFTRSPPKIQKKYIYFKNFYHFSVQKSKNIKKKSIKQQKILNVFLLPSIYNNFTEPSQGLLFAGKPEDRQQAGKRDSLWLMD